MLYIVHEKRAWFMVIWWVYIKIYVEYITSGTKGDCVEFRYWKWMDGWDKTFNIHVRKGTEVSCMCAMAMSCHISKGNYDFLLFSSVSHSSAPPPPLDLLSGWGLFYVKFEVVKKEDQVYNFVQASTTKCHQIMFQLWRFDKFYGLKWKYGCLRNALFTFLKILEV